MMGALYRYLREADPAHFQPMNANFGLLDDLARARARQAPQARALRRARARRHRELAARARARRCAPGRGRDVTGAGSANEGVTTRRGGLSPPPGEGAERLPEHAHCLPPRSRCLRRVPRHLLWYGGVDVGRRGQARDPRIHGAPHATRTGQAHRRRARSPRCGRSTSFCIATRSSRRIRARSMQSPKRDKYLPAYLDRAQIDLLFQMAEARAWEGRFADVRNLAILELFYSTGLRLSELAGVESRHARSRVAAAQGARQGKQGAHRSDRRSRAARAPQLRAEARRARGERSAKIDRTAFFLSRTGTRIGVRAVQASSASSCSEIDEDAGTFRALASPHVRDAPARRRRRSPRRAGAPRPRLDRDDTDLHAHERRAAEAGLRESAPARVELPLRTPWTAPCLHPDSVMSDGTTPISRRPDRRRRRRRIDRRRGRPRRTVRHRTPRVARPERNRVGQGCLGGSLVCTALVLLSGGGSPFSVAATFVGIALVVAGVVLTGVA